VPKTPEKLLRFTKPRKPEEPIRCPTCGKGYDSDGDGNCVYCAKPLGLKIIVDPSLKPDEWYMGYDLGIPGADLTVARRVVTLPDGSRREWISSPAEEPRILEIRHEPLVGIVTLVVEHLGDGTAEMKLKADPGLAVLRPGMTTGEASRALDLEGVMLSKLVIPGRKGWSEPKVITDPPYSHLSPELMETGWTSCELKPLDFGAGHLCSGLPPGRPMRKRLCESCPHWARPVVSRCPDPTMVVLDKDRGDTYCLGFRDVHKRGFVDACEDCPLRRLPSLRFPR
jgi:hypothetical protein